MKKSNKKFNSFSSNTCPVNRNNNDTEREYLHRFKSRFRRKMLTAAVDIEVSIGDDPNAAIYVVTSVSQL